MRYVMTNRAVIGYLRHKGQWIKGIHDPIISVDTFEAANKELDKRRERFEKQGYKTGTDAHTTHLGGLIHCKHCGGKYAKYQTGSKQYGFHLNYCCYSRQKRIKTMIKDPNCKNKIYRIADLDGYIFSQVRKLSFDPEFHIENMKKEKEKTCDNASKIKLLRKEIKSIEAQRSRFMLLYGTGNYSIEELDELTTPLNDRRMALYNEIKSLSDTSDKLPAEQAIKIINSFGEVLDKGNLNEIRSMLELLIEKIIIDNDEIDIHWTFA